MNMHPRKGPTPVIVVAGMVLVVAGGVFAQSRERRSGRERSSRDYSSSFGGAGGPLPPTTGPGLTAESPKPGKPLPADFEVLAEKSIFERDRRPYVKPSESEQPVIRHEAPLPPHVPAVPVLVGVIIGDDASLIAYIEDPDAGKLYPFAVGDVLPGDYGTVQSIHLDGIEIGKDGGTEKQILIGQTLGGNAAPAPSLSDTSPAPSGTGGSAPNASASQPGGVAATGPAMDPNAAGLTTEQRMKLKRQQQMGH